MANTGRGNNLKLDTNLRGSAESGIRWVAISQVARQGLQFATYIFLARLLNPADLGLFGMAMVLVGFAAMFRDFGISALIIQKDNLSQALFNTAYWINITIGIIATLAIYGSSFLAVGLFRQPHVDEVVRALSATCFIGAIGAIYQALLEKALCFKALAVVEIASAIAGATMAVYLAATGFGVWALIWQQLIMIATTTILLLAISPRSPDGWLSLPLLKEVGYYGKNIAGFAIINFLLRNADNFLIGRYIGAEALGIYNFAYKILLFPIQTIANMVGRVSFPSFVKFKENDDELRRHYLAMVQMIATVTFPLMICVMVYSEYLIINIFGQKWSQAISLLFILAPIGLLQSIISPVGQIYLIKGRPDLMFWVVCVTGTLTLTAFAIGVQWGLMGVAIAYAVVTVATVHAELHYPFSLTTIKITDVFRMVKMPFFNSMVVGVISVLGQVLIGSAHSAYEFILWVMAGGFGYLGLCAINNKLALIRIGRLFPLRNFRRALVE